jgi:predicted nucleic acid-binding OB-fold protein
MTINPDIKYKTVELLEKHPNAVSVNRIEYNECWVEIISNKIFIKTFNGTGSSFTIKIHSLDLITAIKTDH